MKEKEAQYGEVKKAFSASSQQKQRKPESTFKFHFCRKIGHFEHECRKFLATQGKGKQSANPMESKQTGDHVLVTTHALSAANKGTWIVDSGATTHMCNDSSLFSNMEKLELPMEVILGDGHSLEGTVEGTVVIEMLLLMEVQRYAGWKTPYMFQDSPTVCLVSQKHPLTSFDEGGCEIVNDQRNVIAFATPVGNLYHLEYCRKSQSANVADKAKRNCGIGDMATSERRI